MTHLKGVQMRTDQVEPVTRARYSAGEQMLTLSTQKVKPDPGSLDRRHTKRRRRGLGRNVGAFAMAAAIGLVAAACTPGTRDGQRATAPADQPPLAELATHPHFLDLETGEATLLPESLEGGESYVASPDGTRVAFVGGGTGGVIKIANIDGTGVRTLPSPPEGFVDQQPRWSPDGTRIVYQERFDDDDHVGNLFVYDFSTGEKTQITDLERGRFFHYDLWPSFSCCSDRPDPETVIFHMARTSGETGTADVWWVPATGGEPRRLLGNAWYPMNGPLPAKDITAYAFLLPSPDLASRSIMAGHPCCPNMRQTLVEANESIWWPTMSPDRESIAYQDGESIYVLDISTGEVSEVGIGGTAEWLDNDTLIVAP
jgi:dipeptidyl aminopeptidase/acylaminoacyl peptidase